jgi:hypothetical protein
MTKKQSESGTANKVICVGSYVTKNQWIDINGQHNINPGILLSDKFPVSAVWVHPEMED